MNAFVSKPAVARQWGQKDGGEGGKGGDETAKLLETLQKTLKENNEKLQDFHGQVKKTLDAHGDFQTELKEKIDESLTKSADLEARIAEAEQKLARRGGQGEGEKAESWGRSVTKSEQFEAFQKAKGGKMRMEVKAITTADGSAGDLIVPERRPGIITPPERQMTVRDLLMPGTTATGVVEYVKESGFTNNAAPTSEGAQKPESTITFDAATSNAKTIAHWIQTSKQVMHDAPQLRSHIDGRMLYGLRYKEELQLLLGDGSSENILGIIPQATAYNDLVGISGPTKIDTLRLAMLQVRVAEYPADGILLNPIDWAEIELTKDSTGGYIFANPQGMATPNMWGKPVVETNAMTSGDFLTGAFGMAAQIFDCEEASVELSTEDRDNFIKNMLTIRAEERLALAVYREEAFVEGSF
ncbi:phage major capsid protein [Parvibaculum sp. MBR-TMA-1.3b-4.2]|jgi:HK97 family phage major capsid protein